MSVEEEVRAASAAWARALVGSDAPTVAGFMTDDWVYVAADGITSRADIVEWITTGRLVHHSMEVVGEARVAAAGDSVLVTARKASSGTWDGVEYTADEWISEVYVVVDGRWRCALSHKTPANA
jgi:uncharacterized protein (TIGR02246 family)